MNARMTIPKAASLARVPDNAPWCEQCNFPCRLTDGTEIYPHRQDLRAKPIWLCDGCKARVGCHPKSTDPLGTPANFELRAARMKLHNLRLDPIWKNAKEKKARGRVYRFLAAKMGIDSADCHTGMFTLEQCRDAWRALANVSYADVCEWIKKDAA